MLARYDIACDSEQALHIKMGGLRGQRPATRAKYRKAIEACERMEHLEKNLSEFAGRFGVDGSGLARPVGAPYLPDGCGRIIRECSSGARRNACA